ncbi:MAG: LacI family DNA-binding transcriptional regulator [Armatimonadota bacterium]|nr:LacI family transcriptional regulator [bacterium]
MGVTSADIARALGLHKATVCRVLRGGGRASAETKERIIKMAQEMNYRPNQLARSLSCGQSQFIGVLASPSIMPAFHLLIDPIERSLSEQDYLMLFTRPSKSKEGMNIALDQLIANRVPGIIAVLSPSDRDTNAFKEVVDQNVKLVVVNEPINGLEVPQIVCDDYKSVRIATEHLISLGHRRIVYLAIPLDSERSRERAKGFTDAMKNAGLPVGTSSIVETELSEEAGAQVMTRLLKRENPPTAVVARQDVVALGAMDAVFSAGLSVPQDVSIVGLGDMWRSNALRVPLTTIHYPFEEMANRGAKILLRLLAGKSVPPKTEVMDAKLVLRSSTAPPRKP